MRLLIFTVLFPPFTVLVMVAPAIARDGFPQLRDMGVLFVLGYILALAPAWAAALVDWLLRAAPIFVRLPLTICAAEALVLQIPRLVGFDNTTTGDFVIFGLMGAIPAAICSGLSHVSRKDERDTGWRLPSVHGH